MQENGELITVPSHVLEGITKEYKLLLENKGFMDLPREQKYSTLASHHLSMLGIFFSEVQQKLKLEHDIDFDLGAGWTTSKDLENKESMQ